MKKKESKYFKMLRYICMVFVIVLGLITIVGTGGGGGGSSSGGGSDGTVSTSVTSGSAVAEAKPASTNSADSPTINMVSYKSVVSPGGVLDGQIDFRDANGDVKEMIIAEKGVNKHNLIDTDSASGINDGYINFSVRLSSELDTGDSIEFDIGLKDENNNVSNYNNIEVNLSNDTQYATTSYSGNFIPNVDGNWDIRLVVNEPNPVAAVGTVMLNQATISQSGKYLTLSDENGSYDGIVRGTDQFLTITYDGTLDFNSQGIDAYADFWATLSGELINSDRIEGESNSIIGRIYGTDAEYIEAYSVACDVTMTRSGGGDSYEPDNTYSQATTISTNGTIQSHSINPAGDVDWVKFSATSGKDYTIETSGCDTYIYLYSTNGTTVLAQDDDGGEGAASMIDWNCSSSGTYYVKVRHYYGSETESYNISVTETELGGGGLGRIDGYVYREGTSPGTPSSGISGVNVCVGNNCVTTGQSSTYTLWNVPVGAQTINATATGYICYENQVTVTEGQLTGDWHNIEMIQDEGVEITSAWDEDYIDDDTSTGDKLYYFNTLSGNSRVEFSLAVPVFDPSAPDAFELGVNLPSTGGYPTNAVGADMSDLRDTPGALLEFNSTSNPPFESGRYYILVEKVGSGGPFRIRATPWN